MAYSNSYPIPQHMLDTIGTCTAGLGGVGILGGAIGPGADLVVIAPVWAGMVVRLANQAGRNMDQQTAKKLCMTVATGVGTFVAGTKIASTVAGWLLALPTAGLSVVANMTANAALNAALTRAFGRAVALYFLQTGEIERLDVAARILVTLVGVQLGVPTSTPDIVA
jgi:uncharacterized protein (DUF697 family)